METKKCSKKPFVPTDTVERELLDALRKLNPHTKQRVAFETTDVKSLTCRLRELVAEKLGVFEKVCVDNNRTQPIIDIIEIITQNLT